MPQRVIFSPTIPVAKPNNAGELYLTQLEAELTSFDTTYVVPDSPNNREAAQAEHPFRTILVAEPAYSSRKARVRAAATRLRERGLPSRTEHGMRWAIRRDRRLIAALKHADLIDLQWPEIAGLAPLLRRYLPDTRIIATMHDIHSQKWSREAKAATTPKDATRYRLAWARAKRMERSISENADCVVVFSSKDQALLPETARSVVVYPPLAAGSALLERRDTHPPYVLFVGPLHRAENADAMLYFTTEVWPLVRAELPNARLLIAGRKPADPASSIASAPGVELLGFVDDIDDLYSGAAAVIAPIRLGAGLKFKVLDALVRGIPLIATSVAFEGVETGSSPLTSIDSTSNFAAAVSSALKGSAADWDGAIPTTAIRSRYGLDQFRARLRGVYGAELGEHQDSTKPLVPPAVSVVIPVKNGEGQLGDQLDALANQENAPDFEVIVSDNGSTDRTKQVALAYAGRFADIRVVDASDKSGVNFARNTGVKAARGTKILICDHDDTVSENWVAALSSALDEVDAAGGLSIPVWRDPNGTRRSDRASAAALRDCLGYYQYALGANMAVRRAVFIESGGFDESFWGGHDEVEFSWRLQRMGATLAAVEEAELQYLQRTSLKGTYRQALNSSRTRIQLWSRYHELADLSPVSYRGAVDEALRAIRGLPGLLSRQTRNETVRALGSAVGTATGHVKYRLLGSPPPPELADFTDSRGVR